jgi:PTS system, glucose subfamily, IIA component
MKDIRIESPLGGQLIALAEVKDAAFAAGSMGRGAAVAGPEGTVYAPFDGTVEVLFPTGHAIGLKSVDGIELLIHVGLDTVNLAGKNFTVHTAAGESVSKGQCLLSFDVEAIAADGYDLTTPLVVTNAADFGSIEFIAADGQSRICSQPEFLSQSPAPLAVGAAGTAAGILEHIGGSGNIRSMEHCATRLRLILKDKSQFDAAAVEAVPGVKGQFFAASQYQIILGTGFVNKVYEEMLLLVPGLSSSHQAEAYAEMSLVQKISRTFGDVFVPIIPVLVATGLFMGLRGMAQSLGIVFNENFLRLSQILTDTAFAFLPALVTWSTMKKFGGTPVIGIVLGLMLVAPQLPNAYAVAGGQAQVLTMDFFGLVIPVVGYQGSVLPALVLGIIAAKLQKWLKSFVPDLLDLIVTPFLTLLLSLLVGLLLVGPVMHTIEIFLFTAVKGFLELPFGIGGLIVGGLHQVIVVSGVHHVFNALEIELLATTGRDAFNAIITGAIVAQGGAALAVAVKTRNPRKRSLYLSSTIPAFLGITEPAIFGINLRFVKPFFYALVGGAAAGMCAGMLQLAGTGMGITVIPGTLLYMDHLLEYFFVNAVGFGTAFALTFFLFKPEE